MNRIAALIFVVPAVVLLAAAPSFCGDKDEPKIMSVDGTVVSADWEKIIVDKTVKKV